MVLSAVTEACFPTALFLQMMTSYENHISRPYFRNHFMNVYCIFSNYFSCFFLNPTHSTRSQHLSITTMKTSKQWEDFYLKKKKKENIATAHDTPHCLSQAPAVVQEIRVCDQTLNRKTNQYHLLTREEKP